MAEIVNSAEITKTHAAVQRHRSTFPQKQDVLDTMRFAEYHPFIAFDGVASDKLPWRCKHNVRSYTLKAPLMQDVYMNKDYFLVPLRSVLPFQADRVLIPPTAGDDVPADAYTNVSNFLSKIKTVSDKLDAAIADYLDAAAGNNPTRASELVVKRMVFLESIFSNGCLLSSLGCNLSNTIDCSISGSKVKNFDTAFDAFITYLSTAITNAVVSVDGVNYDLAPSPSEGQIGLRRFLEIARDDATWSFDSLTLASGQTDFYNGWLKNLVISWLYNFGDNVDYDLDLLYLWSYHLCHAEFYTDSKIDSIYSAELFRQYILDLITDGGSSNAPGDFSWNGLHLQYDYLSAKGFDVAVSNLDLEFGSDSYSVFQYFLTLFGYHRSLRFKDYFVGSRTRPLAVADNAHGDIVPVVNNGVSIVDTAYHQMAARFRNFVMSTGRKFEEYFKGLFGTDISPDLHNPMFIARTTDSIFAAPVENTGDAQVTDANSVTAVFRGNGGQYEFTANVSETCVIMGIMSFDIERAYSHGIERKFFKKDRYDMFLPQMQFVGDQPIYLAELNARFMSMAAFGYTYRDMDRKMMINRASGAFCDNELPGYAFVMNSVDQFADDHISSDFIRSKSSELDQFYLSLTGYSLGTYFHFICLLHNDCPSSRPMVVHPQIFGQ